MQLTFILIYRYFTSEHT
uniref:Uncharacterized protein n=1 Tax=Rhizophora mucronata TaxID=61149 RepID=A0A2P2QR20_RHIMU